MAALALPNQNRVKAVKKQAVRKGLRVTLARCNRISHKSGINPKIMKDIKQDSQRKFIRTKKTNGSKFALGFYSFRLHQQINQKAKFWFLSEDVCTYELMSQLSSLGRKCEIISKFDSLPDEINFLDTCKKTTTNVVLPTQTTDEKNLEVKLVTAKVLRWVNNHNEALLPKSLPKLLNTLKMFCMLRKNPVADLLLAYMKSKQYVHNCPLCGVFSYNPQNFPTSYEGDKFDELIHRICSTLRNPLSRPPTDTGLLKMLNTFRLRITVDPKLVLESLQASRLLKVIMVDSEPMIQYHPVEGEDDAPIFTEEVGKQIDHKVQAEVIDYTELLELAS